MRSFIAISLPEDVQDTLAEVADALREEIAGVRWVRRENLHLTLRFLGDVDDAAFAELKGRLTESMRHSPVVPMRIDGLGVFPNLRKPAVVWAGVDAVEELMACQKTCEAAAVAAGIAAEERPFRPHITLGRIPRGKRITIVREALDKLGERCACEFRAERVSLLSSTLRPSGPQYETLLEVPLCQSSS